jgi:ribose 5-phosphate isomerase B
MTIAFGNDHAGFVLRDEVLEILKDLKIDVIDNGTYSDEPVDFPIISADVCRAVLDGRADRGLLLCGSGIGAAIAANKVNGIRAGLCHDTYCAHQGVEHDDMNVMCLGARIIGPWLASEIIRAFVSAKFDNTEDVVRRVGMLVDMQQLVDSGSRAK